MNDVEMVTHESSGLMHAMVNFLPWIHLILMVYSLFRIRRYEMNPMTRLLCVLLIVFLPVVGSLVFLLAMPKVKRV